jgi:hypothetical protein
VVASVNTIRGNSVHLGRIGGYTEENGELTASAGTDYLLISDRRIVNQCGRGDIVNGTLAGLVVTGETP